MKYEVIIHSAITLLNAIGIGKGSTMGTDVKHKLRIQEGNGIEILTNPDIDNKLVNTCLEYLSEKYEIAIDNIKIETDLKFKAQRGLKTSSITSLGIIKLLSDYYDLKLSGEDMIRISCEASIDAGVSITGAIDDAYGCYYGGFVITDNFNMKLIANHELNIDKEVVYLVPNDINIKSNIDVKLDLIEKYILKNTYKMCLEGNWMKSIENNTNVYSDYVLRDPDLVNSLREDLIGVLGLNGLGPSLFLIQDRVNSEYNLDILKENYAEYEIMRANFK